MTVPPYGVWWSMELGFASDGTVRWRTNSTTWDEWSERQFYDPPDPMDPADAAYEITPDMSPVPLTEWTATRP